VLGCLVGLVLLKKGKVLSESNGFSGKQSPVPQNTSQEEVKSAEVEDFQSNQTQKRSDENQDPLGLAGKETTDQLIPSFGAFAMDSQMRFDSILSQILSKNSLAWNRILWQRAFEEQGVQFEAPRVVTMSSKARMISKGKGGLFVKDAQIRLVKEAESGLLTLEGMSFSFEGGKEGLEYAFQRVKAEVEMQAGRFTLVQKKSGALYYQSEEGYTLLVLWSPPFQWKENGERVFLEPTAKSPGTIQINLMQESVHI
jgi:hypothetical protein